MINGFIKNLLDNHHIMSNNIFVDILFVFMREKQMDINERHIYESNLLAFKFACIVQAFEMISTVVYARDRVGFINTAGMLIFQAI